MANTDPLQSFLAYVADVKPYHTKVFEVLMEYTYQEPMNVTIKDNIKFEIVLHTLGDTDPLGYMYGGGAHQICPGIGWDTMPWDQQEMWDYPYICNLLDPRLINVTMAEKFNVEVTMMYQDEAFTFMFDRSGGWDIPPWDMTPWDYVLGAQFTVQDEDADEVSQTTITEAFTLTWSDSDGSSGTVSAEA